MGKYVTKESIVSCIEYFRTHTYKKPEQIGLFFYFKGKGLNDLLFTKYEKWGDTPTPERRESLRLMYDLSGIFDAKKETGSKRASLFPFSIAPSIKANAFYNGATPFTNLISRISDTLDNALVSTFIKRNNTATNEIKLANGYIDLLTKDYLLNSKIPLELFAAWCYRFWNFEMPTGSTDQDFKDACVLAFLQRFCISEKEFDSLFFYGSKTITTATSMVSGDELRKAIKFTSDVFPEIKDEPTGDLFALTKTLSTAEVSDLLAQRQGPTLTAVRIKEILSERDSVIQKEYDLSVPMDDVPEAEVEQDAVPDYDINQLGALLTSMYNGAENKTTAIHMFGIKYGAVIKKNGYTSVGIVSASGISESYHVEVSKGIRIYEAILNNEYGVKFSDGTSSPATIPTKDALPQLPKRMRTKFPLNCILYGAPGTGKTYATAQYALAIAENKEITAIAHESRLSIMERYNKLVAEGCIVFTTFHQSYGYEDFIQGIRPDTASGNMAFKTVDGVFKRISDEAMKHPEKDFVIIIDEINRANISKVFGELITLIEEDKRWGEENAVSVSLPSGDTFAIPNNLYIIGTMNSADKSISLIDTALRRRFSFIEYTPQLQLITDSGLRQVLERLNKGIAKELNSTDLLVGHSYFMNKSAADLCDIMNRNIIPLLYEYFFDNSKKVEAQIKDAIEGMNVEIESNAMGRLRLKKKDVQ